MTSPHNRIFGYIDSSSTRKQDPIRPSISPDMMSNQILRPTEATEADAHTVTAHNECVWPSLDDKNPFAVLSTDDVCESESEHSEDVPGHVEDASEPSDKVNEHEHEHDATCRLLQQVDTLGIEYDNWSPRPVVVYSNFEEHYLFAIRKPFIIYQDIKNKIKSVLESQLDVLRSSRLYKGIIKSINTVKFLRELEHEASHTNVTTKNGVRKMLTELVKLPADGQSMVLSFDCEGDNLGRNGTTCYLQIRDNVAERIYLVDLLTLGQKAWFTPAQGSATTLQDIFQNPKLVKLIFDVRSDSDALYNHYGIKLAGVLDVQYLKMLCYRYYCDRRPGYNRTMIDSDCLDNDQETEFARYKQYPFGRDYSRFMDRPLPPILKLYAVNDVRFLHVLAAHLKEHLTAKGLDFAYEWTDKEIKWTWEEDYYEDHYPTDDDPYARACTKDSFSRCWKERINTT
ncbi:hypothetical protein LTR64_004495 [Lithohypha guttulata]|uniref:uncharacterized protein n=1 Tax=Lithohypha guttulata TaxID=1690604 RepID=UPI00315C5EBF